MSLNEPTGDNTPDDPDEAGASGAPYPPHDDPFTWAGDPRAPMRRSSLEPLPNRVNGDTAWGCVGMLCLVVMLALLWLGIGGLGLPFWLTALTPFMAFSVAGLAFGLLARVPTGPTPRSRDPRHPLTRAGTAPIIERPAELANHLMAGASGALALVAIAGYLTLSFDPMRARGVFWGPIIITLAGLALVLEGALVSLHAAPTPALRWVRTPIQGYPPREAIWLFGGGAVAALSGVYLAFISGAVWGYILVGAFILLLAISVMLYSLWQRRPRRRRPPPGYYAYSARRPNGPDATGNDPHDAPDDRPHPSTGE